MVRQVLAITALFWGVSWSAAALATEDEQPTQSERIEHYQPLASDTLTQAVANLQSHNAHLQQLLDRPSLSAEDMTKVHELTYTLELALERLQTELNNTADVLEEIHVGSETMDANRVRDNAERYLEVMSTVFQ